MPISLHKHAVIEASAGTGKTYTIEQIVLRLLLEENVALEEILLVTFTEKATGELKGRLRNRLEEKLRAHSDLAQRTRLESALDNFDQASIFTIHGFCQRLLAEYAFEQGQDLRREVVKDAELIDPVLRQVQRRIWRQEFGPQLAQALALAEYNWENAGSWEKIISDLTTQFKPDYDILLPAPFPSEMNLEVRENACRKLVTKLHALAGDIPPDPLTHGWYASWQKIKIHAQTRKHRGEKFVAPLLHWLAEKHDQEQTWRSFFEFQNQIQEVMKDAMKGFSGSCFSAFFNKISEEAQKDIAVKCPGLTEAIFELNDFYQEHGKHRFADQLAVMTIGHVCQALSNLKKERGQLSYDDMIANVYRALEPSNPGSRPFIDTLRRRFRYAIVDEFQDTDPLQWGIFQRLFVQGNQTRLIVVGDPKQAIFGFRGADLPTYQQASQAMLNEFEAVIDKLKINYRTVPELLEPLNLLFQKGQWFLDDSDIVYEPVGVPEEIGLQTTVFKDLSGRSPFTIVNLQDATSLKKAQKEFACFTAKEISWLLRSDIQFKQKQKLTKLHAGHICVLVLKRNEADPLIQELREARIPFCFYKKTGLWSSAEAEHLGTVLGALAAPEDRAKFRKALLTAFFRVSPVQIALCEEISANHPARALFDHWLACAETRQWSALSQSLMEDSGILFYDFRSGDLDRRFSNLSFMLRTLEQAAYRDNLDLLDLLDFFENCRRKDSDQESDFQPIETEQAKIQIMTIHASKGLEFPIVFLAGGFTKKSHSNLTKYHKDGRRVFDLNPDAEAKESHKKEELAEYRRLFYVGLTRAMLKVYVPLVCDKEKNMSYAGPVATVLAPAIQQVGPSTLDPLFNSQVHISLREMNPHLAERDDYIGDGCALVDNLFPPLPADLSKRRLLVRSFSSIHRAAERFQFSEEKKHLEQEDSEPVEDPFRGPIFGDLVHQVLETIDFAAVAAAGAIIDLSAKGSSLRKCLDACISREILKMRSRTPMESLHDACAELVAQLVWNALRTPLPGLNSPLCDVPPSERIHELEFLFPHHPEEPAAAEIIEEDGFFTGFMDLVFRKNGFYYLVDWKTNFLEGYDARAISQAMMQSDYHRQYRLYLHALERWLRRRHGPGFDFMKQFGGVYYLFLRGMNGTQGSPGIFYHRPSPTDLKLDLVLANK